MDVTVNTATRLVEFTVKLSTSISSTGPYVAHNQQSKWHEQQDAPAVVTPVACCDEDSDGEGCADNNEDDCVAV